MSFNQSRCKNINALLKCCINTFFTIKSLLVFTLFLVFNRGVPSTINSIVILWCHLYYFIGAHHHPEHSCFLHLYKNAGPPKSSIQHLSNITSMKLEEGSDVAMLYTFIMWQEPTVGSQCKNEHQIVSNS